MKMLFIQLHHTLNFLCFLSLPTVFAHVKLHIQTTLKSWSSFGEMMLDRNNKECIFHKLVVFFFSVLRIKLVTLSST